MRSITIDVPPACGTSNVVSTCMFRIVSGRQSPFRRLESQPRVSPAPGRAAAGCAGCAPHPSAAPSFRSCTRCPPARTDRQEGRPPALKERPQPRPSTRSRRSSSMTTEAPQSSTMYAFSGGASDPVDAHPHRAEPHRSTERHDDVDIVRQRHRDPITGRHTECQPCMRRGVGEPVEFGVRPPSAGGHQRLVCQGPPRRE